MLPLITIKKKKKLAAGFSDFFHVSAYEGERNIYSVSSRARRVLGGRFFVAADSSKGEIDGFISIGYVNGFEPLNQGQRISVNPRVKGPLPYVCLKLEAPKGGGLPAEGDNPATCGEIVCSETFGVQGDFYFHPIAKFSINGKVAQCVNTNLFYSAYRKVPRVGWVHEISAA